MILSLEERLNLQYILPVQGNLKTLELVENILRKKFEEESKEMELSFTNNEMKILKECIKVLDENNMIPLSAHSLVKKILGEK